MAYQVIASAYTDGPTLTGAAAASCVPTYVPAPIPGNYWQIGRTWRITANGRISCVVTTPGTARFDLRMGATTVWDTLAMPLNIVAKTNVVWNLNVLLTCRSVGPTAGCTLMGIGNWFSEASLNTALPATGPGPGGQSVPYNTAPVVGTGFDSTISNQMDFRFTQTVATGSMTMHQFCIEQLY